MAKLYSEQTATRHAETASRILDGEAVILRPMDNMILSLNETGTRIWELLADGPSVARIVQTIHDEFDVDQATAVADVQAFLEKMEEKGLIALQ